MSAHAAAWAEHNAARWSRPDASRFAPPSYKARVGCERKDGEVPRSVAPALHALRYRHLLLKCHVAELAFVTRLRRLERKNWQDQPREPAGGPGGGQWVAEGASGAADGSESLVDAIFGEASDWSYDEDNYGSSESAASSGDDEDHTSYDEDNYGSQSEGDSEGDGSPKDDPATNPDGNHELELSDARRGGHHIIPREIFGKEPLQDATRKVFENATTGPLRDPSSNYYDRMHREYNSAVAEKYQEYLAKNGIRSETMTPTQAEKFVEEVKTSTDPRIRRFNVRLKWREFMSKFPRRPEY